METINAGILGHKAVTYKDDTKGFVVFGRLNNGTQITFNSKEMPTGDGALLDFYKTGEKPEWANTPFEKDTYILQYYSTITSVTNAKAYTNAMEPLDA